MSKSETNLKTMETYNTKLVKNGIIIDGALELTSENSECHLKLSFSLDDENNVKESFSTDYFYALIELREKIELFGLTIACNGSRKDFYPSRMAIQMSEGKVGYLMELGKKATKKVRTFDECLDVSLLSTVKEQDSYYRQWCDSIG